LLRGIFIFLLFIGYCNVAHADLVLLCSKRTNKWTEKDPFGDALVLSESYSKALQTSHFFLVISRERRWIYTADSLDEAKNKIKEKPDVELIKALDLQNTAHMNSKWLTKNTKPLAIEEYVETELNFSYKVYDYGTKEMLQYSDYDVDRVDGSFKESRTTLNWNEEGKIYSYGDSFMRDFGLCKKFDKNTFSKF
jgi:hypothetical protein